MKDVIFITSLTTLLPCCCARRAERQVASLEADKAALSQALTVAGVTTGVGTAGVLQQQQRQQLTGPLRVAQARGAGKEGTGQSQAGGAAGKVWGTARREVQQGQRGGMDKENAM